MKFLSLFSLAFFWFSFSSASVAEINLELAQSSLEKSERFWKDFSKDNCWVTTSKGSSTMEGGEVQATPAITQTVDWKNGVSKIAMSMESGFESVVVAGDRYCFELLRMSKNVPWQLRNYVINSDPDVDTSKIGFSLPTHRLKGGELLNLRCSVHGIAGTAVGLRKLLHEDPSVTMMECTGVNPGLVIRYQRKGKDSQVIDGVLHLDSSMHFLPVYLKEDCPSDTNIRSMSTKVTYSLVGSSNLNQESTEEIRLVNGKTFTSHIESRTTSADLPQSDFSLTGYGLGEPLELAGNNRRYLLWFMVLVIGAGLIRFGISSRKRR